MPYYNFAEISERIKFKELLDKLGYVYEDDVTELRGKLQDGTDFIVNKSKNLFFCPKDRETKGSVINFVAVHHSCSLTKAAEALTNTFKPAQEPTRDIPDLKLHYSPILEKMGISIETCKELEIGLVKERSVMSGKIAFAIKDSGGNKVGYVGWNEKQGWYFPKGHRQIYVYNLHNCQDTDVELVSDTFEVARLHQKGVNAITLMTASSNMTEEQEKTLKSRFSSILVKVPNPLNIVNRLANGCFVKIE